MARKIAPAPTDANGRPVELDVLYEAAQGYAAAVPELGDVVIRAGTERRGSAAEVQFSPGNWAVKGDAPATPIWLQARIAADERASAQRP